MRACELTNPSCVTTIWVLKATACKIIMEGNLMRAFFTMLLFFLVYLVLSGFLRRGVATVTSVSGSTLIKCTAAVCLVQRALGSATEFWALHADAQHNTAPQCVAALAND